MCTIIQHSPRQEVQLRGHEGGLVGAVDAQHPAGSPAPTNNTASNNNVIVSLSLSLHIYIYIYISKFGGCKRQDSLS